MSSVVTSHADVDGANREASIFSDLPCDDFDTGSLCENNLVTNDDQVSNCTYKTIAFNRSDVVMQVKASRAAITLSSDAMQLTNTSRTESEGSSFQMSDTPVSMHDIKINMIPSKLKDEIRNEQIETIPNEITEIQMRSEQYDAYPRFNSLKRDAEVIRRTLRKADVRFLNGVTKNIKNIVRSKRVCDPELCPNMRVRLYRHHFIHHNKFGSTSVEQRDEGERDEENAADEPQHDRMVFDNKLYEIKMSNSKNDKVSIQTNNLQINEGKTTYDTLNSNIESSMTLNLFRNTNIAAIKSEVLKILDNVPELNAKSSAPRDVRKVLVNNFIDKIVDTEFHKIRYKDEIVVKVKSFLNSVPMWHTGDQTSFKNGIVDKILKVITAMTQEDCLNRSQGGAVYNDKLHMGNANASESRKNAEELKNNLFKQYLDLPVYIIQGILNIVDSSVMKMVPNNQIETNISEYLTNHNYDKTLMPQVLQSIDSLVETQLHTTKRFISPRKQRRLDTYLIYRNQNNKESKSDFVSLSTSRQSNTNVASIRSANSRYCKTNYIRDAAEGHLNQIESVVDKWVDSLPIKITNSDYKDVKSAMVQDLTADALDRQKFLGGHTEINEIAEIEHWKYQTFRWLSKILSLRSVSDFTPYIPYVQDLYVNLKSILGQMKVTSNNTSSIAIKNCMDEYINQNANEDDPMTKEAISERIMLELKKTNSLTADIIFKDTNIMLYQQVTVVKEICLWVRKFSDDMGPFMEYSNKEKSSKINLLADQIFETVKFCSYQNDSEISDIITIWLENILRNNFSDQRMSTIVDYLVARLKSTKLLDRTENSNNPDPEYEKSEETDLVEIVQDFIKLKNDVFDNTMTKDAYVHRLLETLRNFRNSLDCAPSKRQYYERLLQVPVPGEVSVNRFSRELELTRKISEWLKSVKIINPRTEKERKTRKRMINVLAQNIFEVEQKEPSTEECKLIEVINDWLHKLSLHEDCKVLNIAQKLVMILKEQNSQNILFGASESPVICGYMQDSGNRAKNKPLQSTIDVKKSEVNIHFCKDVLQANKDFEKEAVVGTKPYDEGAKPADVLLTTVREWVDSLSYKLKDPIKVRETKLGIQFKLLQKIGDINKDPKIVHDEILYKDALLDEINRLVDDNICCSENKKQELIENVYKINKASKQYSSEYKNELERVALHSILKHVNPQANNAFNLLKVDIAEMFLLSLYDDSNNKDILSEYERKVSKELKNLDPDCDFHTIKVKIFNDLISVTKPEATSIVTEIQEIRIKYVLSIWISQLPLISQVCQKYETKMEIERIKSAMAKTISHLQMNEKSNEEFSNEIRRWLSQLPVNIGTLDEIDFERLRNRLRSILFSKETFEKYNVLKKDNYVLNSPKGYHESDTKFSYEKLNDITEQIYRATEIWYDRLPILNTDAPDVTKREVITDVILKITKMNIDDFVFNDEILYRESLLDELQLVLDRLPLDRTKCNATQDITEVFVQTLENVNWQIKREREKNNFKRNVSSIVSEFIDNFNLDTDIRVTEELKQTIVDNFIEYSHYEDEFTKEAVKSNMLEATAQMFDKMDDFEVKQQNLFLELQKIKVPTVSLHNEVEEIKTKQEVMKWMKELSFDNVDCKTHLRRNKIALIFVKQINRFEKSNIDTEEKLEAEIKKFLIKVNFQGNINEAINKLISRLKNTKLTRKSVADNESTRNEIKDNVTNTLSSKQFSEPSLDIRESSLDESIESKPATMQTENDCKLTTQHGYKSENARASQIGTESLISFQKTVSKLICCPEVTHLSTNTTQQTKSTTSCVYSVELVKEKKCRKHCVERMLMRNCLGMPFVHAKSSQRHFNDMESAAPCYHGPPDCRHQEQYFK